MHQLIGRRRPGLRPQAAQLCTTCLVVLGAPATTTSIAKTMTMAAPRWARAASLHTVCPALQWRQRQQQLRRYTTPTRPMLRPVDEEAAAAADTPEAAAETDASSPPAKKTKTKSKADSKAKAKRSRAVVSDTKAVAAAAAAAAAATTASGRKSSKKSASSKLKSNATAAAAVALLKTGIGQKQVRLWSETLSVLKKLEATQDRLAEQAAEKAAKAAETAKAFEAANAQFVARAAGVAVANPGEGAAAGEGAAGESAATAEGEAAATETAPEDTVIAETAPATKKKAAKKAVVPKPPAEAAANVFSKKVRKRAAAAESLAAHAAADAEAAQAAVVAAKDAQTQVKLLTNALHLLKEVLSSPESTAAAAAAAAAAAGSTPADKAASGKRTSHKSKAAQDDKATRMYIKGMAGDNTIIPKSKIGAALLASAAAAGRGGDVNAEPTETEDGDVVPATGKGKGKGEKGEKKDDKKDDKDDKDSNDSRYRVAKINTKALKLTPILENMREVPRLFYGLDRALFNPGVYHLQDPHSRVFNFDPYLASIMPLREFDFNALKQYLTSSKDPTLINMAQKHKMRYSGSTSSMTSMLSHFHFLLSAWRPINPAHVSRNFEPESFNYTRITRAPAAIFLHWKPDSATYAIDADKEFDSANILSMLGKSMEKLLTLSKEDFEKYRVTRSHELTDAERNDPEAYHYTTFGDFMMRSQLDAHDARLPGTGMFDLKTRAVVSIRMDAQDFKQGLGYEIRSRFGQYESFEREYYDMIRSAFLKYSLQVRMGRMDGIYVAFHNTQRIFGFQYISINEMDLALHGTEDRTTGDREFMVSLQMLNDVLNKATARFPEQSLRIHIETRPSASAPFMYVFAEPVTPEAIEEVQSANKAEIEAFERSMMGIDSGATGDALTDEARQAAEEIAAEVEAAEAEAEAEAAAEAEAEAAAEAEAEAAEESTDTRRNYYDDDDELDSLSVWASMRQRVEETMENEAQGIESVRDTIEDALEESGLLTGRSAEETREYVDALLGAVIATDTEAAAENIYKDAEGEAEADETAVEEVAEAEEADIDSKTEDSPATDITFEDDVAPVEPAQSAETTDVDADEDDADNAPELDIIDEDAVAVVEDASTVVDEDAGTTIDTTTTTTTTANNEPATPSALLSPDNISLKDLIMKLAAQVESAQLRDASSAASTTTTGTITTTATTTTCDEEESAEPAVDTTADTLDDAPKNKRFERILSELMAGRDAKTTTKKAESAAAKTAAAAAAAAATPTTTTTSTPDKPDADDKKDNREVYGMIVTIRNKVNGRYLARPNSLTPRDDWTVEYAIEEIAPSRVLSIYDMLRRRRKTLMARLPEERKGKSGDSDNKSSKPARSSFNRDYLERLYKLSAKGRQARRKQDLEAQSQPLHVYGVDEPLKWSDVFKAPEEEPSEGGKKKKGGK